VNPLRAAALALLLVHAGAGAGCVTPSQHRVDSLNRSAREFNDGLRWGRDDQVLSCLGPEDAKALRARRADLGDDLVIADQEVKSIEVGPNADKATVVAEFSWFNQRRNVVEKSTIQETWTWSENHWLVTEQRRIAGAHFPLVPEHAAH
jgi:hypothetical protein